MNHTHNRIRLALAAAAAIMTFVACDAKDLTRQGVLTALHQVSGLDTGGLIAGTLDYTKTGQPPSRSVYISKVDASVPGGLRVVEGPVEAAPAKTYQAGA